MHTLKKCTGFTPLCVVCWEGFPLLNVNKYINTLWTTEHQCRVKWGFYLSKTTLKYIEDFISPFWWEGVLFATVLSRCLRHAAFARNTRDVNLNSAHCFLAEAFASLVPAHTNRWHARPSFPLWILVLCVHMSACVWLWHGHLTKLSFFPLIDEFSLIHLLRGDNHLDSRPRAFLPPSLNSWSRTLWHCPDISGIPSSPDKFYLTIIFTDFMQGD